MNLSLLKINVSKNVLGSLHKFIILRQFASNIKMPRDPNDKSPHVSPNRRLSEKFECYPLYMNREELEHSLKAAKLTTQYNKLKYDNQKEKQKILDELLNPACCGKNIIIKQPFATCFGYNLIVGEGFFADSGCVLFDCLPITIGDFCNFGPDVHIYTGTHPVDGQKRREYSIAYPVEIGNNVCIGAASVIGPAVTIGDNVVVGAGSVVVKDVPPNVLIGGNPAKIIRELNVE